MNVNMIGRGRIFFSGIFFLSSLCSASAQSVSLSIDEMFRLADQNSKSIRMHELAISEAEQGVKVAKDGRLPSIGFGLELQYIGDGWLSDRDFSNGVHADMPHFGNSYVIKASQVVYAGGLCRVILNRVVCHSRWRNRSTPTIAKMCVSFY